MPTAKSNDVQHGGDHYRTKAVQPWDYIHRNGIGYLEGNAIKYLSRWREKGGLQDLLKAKHYVEKLIEECEAESRPPEPTSFDKDPCDHDIDEFVNTRTNERFVACVKCFKKLEHE